MKVAEVRIGRLRSFLGSVPISSPVNAKDSPHDFHRTKRA